MMDWAALFNSELVVDCSTDPHLSRQASSPLAHPEAAYTRDRLGAALSVNPGGRHLLRTLVRAFLRRWQHL